MYTLAKHFVYFVLATCSDGCRKNVGGSVFPLSLSLSLSSSILELPIIQPWCLKIERDPRIDVGGSKSPPRRRMSVYSSVRPNWLHLILLRKSNILW